MVIINKKQEQEIKKRKVDLLDDETLINEMTGLVFCNCNKDIYCKKHKKQQAKYVMIFYDNEKEERQYICPVCNREEMLKRSKDHQRYLNKDKKNLEEVFLNTGIGTRYIDVDISNTNLSIVYNQNIINKTLDIINALSSNDYVEIIIQGNLTSENDNINSKCGKTLLCALIIKSVLSENININIKYITYAELNNVIKSKSESVINEYKKADVLFIDDINCRYSDYSEQQFKDFLDYRYRNTLSTVTVIETVEYSNLILNKLDNAEIIKLGGKNNENN